MMNMEIPENIRMDISEKIAQIPREKIRRLQEMGFISPKLKPNKIYFKLRDEERGWLLNHIILFTKLEKWLERQWDDWHSNHVIKRRKIVKRKDGDELKWEVIPEKEHYQRGDDDSRTNKLRRRLKPGEAWFKVENGKITDKRAKTSPPPRDIEDGWAEIYEDVLDTIDHSIQVVQDEYFEKATSPGGRNQDNIMRQLGMMQQYRDNGERRYEERRRE